jgi:hypothetical protein
VNLGLYYRSDRPLTIGKLRRLAQGLDDRHLPDLVTKTEERVPWINSGCWLRAEGRPVDWLYRLQREGLRRRCGLLGDQPEGFSEATSRLLGCSGQDTGALAGSVDR